ncbi:unnamed protein product [Larinioides sclopetarius]|uniref:Uncharacterized protein n=1 Tax=Larinioides sclopetarius TaxID=280406 RepID=A0AAV1ZGB7_9ARAC
MDTFREIEDILRVRSHSNKACISAIMDDHKEVESTSKNISYDHYIQIRQTTFEVDSMPATSSKNDLQHDRRLHCEDKKNNPSGCSETTFNQPSSTVTTLKSEFPSLNQTPSTSARNPSRGIYDHVPNFIYGIIDSEMKTDAPGVNELYAQAEKIKILNDIAAKCIKLASKLKGKMKKEVDNLKPKHPKEEQTEYIKELDAMLDGFPSTSVDISGVIPKRIKGIISETISSGKNTLDISNLEFFFNKTKNKRNIRHVAKSLNIPISPLKKQLKEIKIRCDRDPEPGNKEENMFLKRLERIIKSLN